MAQLDLDTFLAQKELEKRRKAGGLPPTVAPVSGFRPPFGNASAPKTSVLSPFFEDTRTSRGGANMSKELAKQAEEILAPYRSQKLPAEVSMKGKTEYTQEEKDKFSKELNQIITPDQYQMLAEYLGESGLPSRKETVTGLGNTLSKILEVRAQKENPDINWMPLLGYVDQQFGGNSAKYYEKPLSRDELSAAESALIKQLNAERDKLYASDIDLAKVLSNYGVIKQGRDISQGGTTVTMPSITLQTPENRPQPAEKNNTPTEKDQNALADKLLKSDEAKTIGGILTFNNALDEYLALVRRHGIAVGGEAKNELETAYSELKTSYKEAKKLGALSGPDVGILIEGMKPATGLGAMIGSATGLTGGVQGIIKSGALLKKNATNDYSLYHSNATKAYGGYERTDSILNDWNTRAGKIGLKGAPSVNDQRVKNQQSKAAEIRKQRAAAQGSK